MKGNVRMTGRKRLPTAACLGIALLIGLCIAVTAFAEPPAVGSDAGGTPMITAPSGSSSLASGPDREPAAAVFSPEQEPAVVQRDLDGVPAATAGPGEPLSTAPSGTGPPPAPRPLKTPEEYSDIFEQLHGGISSGFLSTANWLDSFFGDERYEAEIGKSQLKVRFDAFREGGTGMDYRRPNFDLRLVLPQMRHKTRLVISGDPNMDVETTGPQPGGTSTAKGTERNLTTQLQVAPVETKYSNFSIRAGLKFHSGQFAVLAGPRYRYLIPLDPWDLRFTQEFIWSTNMRWQSGTRFDLERPLPSGLFFRTSLEGVWSENVAGYPYALKFLLIQPLDRNRALEYEWINGFQTYPTNELVEELLVFRYRQRFWRDWLFLEIDPQYRFPRDRSFHAVPGILFRLEMVFGDMRSIF